MVNTEALRQAMETTLAANPDDLATHMAYGDLLSETGDPRGEFIQVQLALEDPRGTPEERAQLQKREQKLLAAHLAEWVGEAAPLFTLTKQQLERSDEVPFGLSGWYIGSEYFKVQFRRGWIDSLELGDFNPSLIQALGQSPTLRLLRVLKISDESHDSSAFADLQGWPCLDGLRVFRFGSEGGNCHANGEAILPFVQKLPKVEELHLAAHGVPVREVFALPMPTLRALSVHHLHEYPFEVLAANRSLANLVSLSCWPHALEPGHDRAYITADGFLALTQSPYLKSLTELKLFLSDIGDRGIAALVESGMLRRLRVLELFGGCITDAGARALAASPDLRRLQKLNLTQNMLTAEGIAALAATGVPLETGFQHDQSALEEHEYLFEGDCE